MKIFRSINCFTASLLMVSLILALPDKVFASPPLNGITISPAIEEITALPGQSSYSTSINVTDNTANQVVIAISAEDFTASNYSNSLTFITPGSLNVGGSQHGLAGSIVPGITQLALSPKQTGAVPITIQNINDLQPGGHYAAIIFKSIGVGSNSKSNNVGINQIVSSLIFLSTSEGGTQSVQLSNPDLGSFYFTMPSTLNLVFTNTGNTQTTPRGVIIIKKGKQEVARGVIGINTSILLPGVSGIYAVNMIKEVSHFSSGKYSIQIQYNTAEQKSTSLYNKQYFYLNYRYIIVVAAIMIVILTGLYWLIKKLLLRYHSSKH
jgi:hypothetical protein